MSSITTSLSPNTEFDDVSKAWSVLLCPWLWRRNTDIKAIAAQIEKLLPNHHTALVSSGRAAIYRTLQGHDISQGDDVIVQAFTCLAVPAAIQWTSATPIYADINPSTYNLDPQSVRQKITDRTRAIIVQHTFGIPGPIEELQAIAREHNLILIEDLAHGLGGTYNSQPLGTFGDAAILSFGRDKTISSVFGGAVVSKDKQLIEKITKQQEALPLPPVWWVVQQLLHPIFMSVIIPLYFTAGLGKAVLVLSQRLKFLSMAVTASEKRGLKPPFIEWRFSPALAQLLHLQLNKLQRFTQHRRTIAHSYQEALKLSISEQLLTDSSWLRIPLRIKNKTNLLKRARHHKMLLGDWYSQPVTPSATTSENVSGYKPGSCPNAEQAAQEVINLPTHIKLSEEDIGKIIGFIRSHAGGAAGVPHRAPAARRRRAKPSGGGAAATGPA